jgi:hypothetical protein
MAAHGNRAHLLSSASLCHSKSLCQGLSTAGCRCRGKGLSQGLSCGAATSTCKNKQPCTVGILELPCTGLKCWWLPLLNPAIQRQPAQTRHAACAHRVQAAIKTSGNLTCGSNGVGNGNSCGLCALTTTCQVVHKLLRCGARLDLVASDLATVHNRLGAGARDHNRLGAGARDHNRLGAGAGDDGRLGAGAGDHNRLGAGAGDRCWGLRLGGLGLGRFWLGRSAHRAALQNGQRTDVGGKSLANHRVNGRWNLVQN